MNVVLVGVGRGSRLMPLTTSQPKCFSTVAGNKVILADLPERFDIGLGCVDCCSAEIDTPVTIAGRVREALKYVAPERVTIHPDCGFAPGSAADIPIDEAYLKLRNEVLASQILREEYA